LKLSLGMKGIGEPSRARAGLLSRHPSITSPIPRGAAARALVVALIAAGAGGCASTVPRYVTAPPTDAAPLARGDEAQAVFHADVVREALAAEPRADAPELSRNVGVLAQREPQSAFDAAAWPTAPAPTLAGLRRITLTESRRSTTVYLFREQRSTTWYAPWPQSSSEYRPWPR
jgi:hypothetical protein